MTTDEMQDRIDALESEAKEKDQQIEHLTEQRDELREGVEDLVLGVLRRTNGMFGGRIDWND